MPITLSTIPKKSTKSTKKQDDATRVYKSNVNGPGPNAPQPPSESDATDDNETSPPPTETCVTVTPKPNPKPSKKKSTLAQRLEVNKLLAELYPSNHIKTKVAALEALSAMEPMIATTAANATEEIPPAPPAKRTRARKSTKAATSPQVTDQQEDLVAKAIIDRAFNASASAVSASAVNQDSFKTPPTSPPNGNGTNAPTNAPNAPKKSKQKEAMAPPNGSKKQKQKFNIIIHVEPKSGANDAANASAKNDISKRLDFGNKAASAKSREIVDDDDSDEDYVPGCSESDDQSWNTYDEEDGEYDDDEDDDEYDDESYYSSSSESDDEDAEELEQQQEKFTAEMKMLQSLRQTYEGLLSNDKTNRVVAKQLKTLKESEDKIKKELDELTHRQKRKNSKKFRKLMRRKSSTNDLDYFKKHLTLQQQRAMIDEMNAVAKVTEIEKPYKLTLLESDIPRDMKAVAIRKIGMLQYMEPGCGEYCKLKNWVDAFMQIPFNRNKNLPLTIADGVERCHEFMTDAKTQLDNAVYGLNDAKMQIMQMVGQWIANPAAIGTAVAIHGPPGTGKTSLVKEGISKILGRDFAFIALGGATDSSFLEGHSYTYEGSMWGKIVDILIRCRSSNPVIYFDELDKISETSKGEEIVGILTHLTDTSQNSQFHDKYFSEVAFDLSKCLFIFSYNDESRVNPVLLDRMYKIRTTGYGTKDKTFIAQHHLIPHIRSEVNFAEGDIVIPDAVVEYIVDHCTHKEAGVRNLKRCLEIIYTKLNLYRLMRPGTQLFDDKEKSFEVSFPYTVTRDVVDKLIKRGEDRPNINMYL
jgi:ATP-dependent Lon protease